MASPCCGLEQMETGPQTLPGRPPREYLGQPGRYENGGMEWTEVDYGATGLYEPVGLVLTELRRGADMR